MMPQERIIGLYETELDYVYETGRVIRCKLLFFPLRQCKGVITLTTFCAVAVPYSHPTRTQGPRTIRVRVPELATA